MSERTIVRIVVEEIENPSREEFRKQVKHGLFAVQTSSTNMGYWLNSIEAVEDEVCDFDIAHIWYGEGNSPEVHFYNMHELSQAEQEELKIKEEKKELGSDDSMKNLVKTMLNENIKRIDSIEEEARTIADMVELNVSKAFLDHSEAQYIDVVISIDGSDDIFPYHNPMVYISPLAMISNIHDMKSMIMDEYHAAIKEESNKMMTVYINGYTFTIKL